MCIYIYISAAIQSFKPGPKEGHTTYGTGLISCSPARASPAGGPAGRPAAPVCHDSPGDGDFWNPQFGVLRDTYVHISKVVVKTAPVTGRWPDLL